MITIQQDNHDKIEVTTTKEEIIQIVKKLYGYRKNIYERFKNFGSADHDRVIYHIYLAQRKQKYNY